MSIPGATYPVNNPPQNYPTGGTQNTQYTTETPPPVEAPVTPPPAQEEPAGVYTPSGDNPTDFRPDRARMEQLWNHHQQQVDNFRRMMEILFNRQAEEQGIAAGTWNPQEIDVTDEMRAAAAEQVAEGGYFSVEETAARILDFAVAISGGDPERLDVLRGAIEQAFENAERIWGGELPEISQQTRAAVMEGLDQWAANGNVADIALLNR